MKLPLQFNCLTTANGNYAQEWQSGPSVGSTKVAIPREFGGQGGGLSPEDLFQMALANCFLATFKVYAHNSKLSFERVEVSSHLIVDKAEGESSPQMKSFFAKIRILGASNPERAKLLAQKAINSGFVLNSVKTEKKFEVSIE